MTEIRVPRNSTHHNLVLCFSSRRLINHRVKLLFSRVRIFAARLTSPEIYLFHTRAGVPFRGMTHKSNLHRGPPSLFFYLVLSRELRSHDADHLAILAIRNRRELSRTFLEMAFRNLWHKKWRGAKTRQCLLFLSVGVSPEMYR